MFKVTTTWAMAFGLLGTGLLTLALGFGYDLMFAGIPYQDPPPALEAQYRFHSRVAGVIEVTGLVLTAVGLASVALLAMWGLFSWSRPQRDAQEGADAG